MALPYSLASIAIEQIGGVKGGESLEELVKKIAKGGFKTTIKSMAEEGMEEVYENWADALLDQVELYFGNSSASNLEDFADRVYGKESSIFNISRDAQAFAGGALGSLGFMGAGKVMNGKVSQDQEQINDLVTLSALSQAQAEGNNSKNIDKAINKLVDKITKNKSEEAQKRSDARQQAKGITLEQLVNGVQNDTLNQLQQNNQQTNEPSQNMRQPQQGYDMVDAMVDNVKATQQQLKNKSLQKYYNVLSSKLGTKIIWDETLQPNEQGSYNKTKNEIRLNPNSADPMGDVITHELTHRIENLAPEEYKAIRNVIANILEKNSNGQYNAIYDKYNRLYNEEHGDDLTDEQLQDEMVADFLGTLLGQNENNLSTLTEIKMEDEGVYQKIVNWIRELINQIRNATKDVKIKGFDINLTNSQINDIEARFNNLVQVAEQQVVKENLTTENEVDNEVQQTEETDYNTEKENVRKQLNDFADEVRKEDYKSLLNERRSLRALNNRFKDSKTINQRIYGGEELQELFKGNEVVPSNKVDKNFKKYGYVEKAEGFENGLQLSEKGRKKIAEYNKYLQEKETFNQSENTKRISEIDDKVKNAMSLYFDYNGKQIVNEDIKNKLAKDLDYYLEYNKVQGREEIIDKIIDKYPEWRNINYGWDTFGDGIVDFYDNLSNELINDRIIKDSSDYLINGIDKAFNDALDREENAVLRNKGLDNIRYSLTDNEKGNMRDKGFLNTANESGRLEGDTAEDINEEARTNGQYEQRTMSETSRQALEFIDSIDAKDEYERLDKAYEELKSGRLEKEGREGIESAIAGELIERYQTLGYYDKATNIVEELDAKAREYGRFNQFLSAWKALRPEGKITWLKKKVKAYNDANPKKKIVFDKAMQEQMQKEFNQLDQVCKTQNETNKDLVRAALENILLENGRFNSDIERIITENTLDTLDLSIDQIKEKIESERIMQVLNQADSSTWRKINTLQTLSHLLNTSTASRNFLSNEAMFAMDRLAKRVGAFVMRDNVFNQKVDNKELKQKAKQKANEVALDIWLGIDGLGNKYTNTTDKSSLKGMIPTFKSPALNSLEKLLGIELKVPDENMKEKVREYIRTKYKNVYGDEYSKHEAEVEEYADQEALYMTFQDDSLPAKAMQNLKKGLNHISSYVTGTEEFGLGDFLVKYTQVPGNLVARTFEYSPFGLIKAFKTMAQVDYVHRKGDLTLVERNKLIADFGRAITGTGLMALGALLAKLGLLTGNKDDNEAMMKLLKDAGVKDGEINLGQLTRVATGNADDEQVHNGDLMVTYDWLQPLSMVMGAGAVLYNDLAHERGLHSIGDVAEHFLDLPCNQSLSTIMQAYQYGYGDDVEANSGMAIVYGLAQAGGDSLAGFIPSVFRHVSNAIDPVSRNTYEQGNVLKQTGKKIARNIPGLSTVVEPNIKADGTTKKYFDWGFGANMLNQALPTRATNVQFTEGTEKIKDILETSDGKSLAKAGNLPLNYAPNKTTYIKEKNEDGKEVGIRLTDKQKTEYMKYYSEYYQKNYLTYVDKVSNRENMSDAQKEKIADQLAKIQTAAKKYAEKKVLGK